jgi:hypothetical protein
MKEGRGWVGVSLSVLTADGWWTSQSQVSYVSEALLHGLCELF